MKPFDLKRALAGDPVVTRDGLCSVLQIAHFPDAVQGHRVVVLFRGDSCPTARYDNGKCSDRTEQHPRDLVMSPLKREGWINIYHNKVVTGLHDSKSVADDMSGSSRIACCRIEWEE